MSFALENKNTQQQIQNQSGFPRDLSYNQGNLSSFPLSNSLSLSAINNLNGINKQDSKQSRLDWSGVSENGQINKSGQVTKGFQNKGGDQLNIIDELIQRDQQSFEGSQSYQKQKDVWDTQNYGKLGQKQIQGGNFEGRGTFQDSQIQNKGRGFDQSENNMKRNQSFNYSENSKYLNDNSRYQNDNSKYLNENSKQQNEKSFLSVLNKSEGDFLYKKGNDDSLYKKVHVPQPASQKIFFGSVEKDLININQEQILAQNLYLKDYTKFQDLMQEKFDKDSRIVLSQALKAEQSKVFQDQGAVSEEEQLRELLSEFELRDLLLSKEKLSQVEFRFLVGERLKEKVRALAEASLYKGRFVVHVDKLKSLEKGFKQVQLGFGIIKKSSLQKDFIDLEKSMLKKNQGEVEGEEKKDSQVTLNRKSDFLEKGLNSSFFVAKKQVEYESFLGPGKHPNQEKEKKSLAEESRLFNGKREKEYVNIGRPKVVKRSGFYDVESSSLGVGLREEFEIERAEEDFFLFIEIIGYSIYMTEMSKLWSVVPLFNEKKQLLSGAFILPFYTEFQNVAEILERGMTFQPAGIKVFLRISAPRHKQLDLREWNTFSEKEYLFNWFHDHRKRPANEKEFLENERKKKENEQIEKLRAQQKMTSTYQETLAENTQNIIKSVTQDLQELTNPKNTFLQQKLYRAPNKWEQEEKAANLQKQIFPSHYPNKTITVQKFSPPGQEQITEYNEVLQEKTHFERIYKFMKTKDPYGYYGVSEKDMNGFDASIFGERFIEKNLMPQEYKTNQVYQDYVAQFNANRANYEKNRAQQQQLDEIENNNTSQKQDRSNDLLYDPLYDDPYDPDENKNQTNQYQNISHNISGNFYLMQ